MVWYRVRKKVRGVKSVLRYPGAKNRIAPWICEHIPAHDVYLEPFAGSLAVLFNKQRCHIETVNDIDGEIVNFFKILRDHKEELMRIIALTPFARDEYMKAYDWTDGDIERARRFAVKCWMGFGCGNLYRNGFKTGQQTNSPNPAKAWGELPETLEQASQRLKGVQIENLPAVELIKRYNTPDVFIYADPPYPHGTRKKYLYKHEMEDSGLKGWAKVQKDTLAEGGRKRTETLWMNYDVNQGQISLCL